MASLLFACALSSGLLWRHRSVWPVTLWRQQEGDAFAAQLGTVLDNVYRENARENSIVVIWGSTDLLPNQYR